MGNRLYGPLTWLLAPLALYQGLQVRARTPRLLPPPGPRTGQVGSDKDAAFRLLIVGDSSAAGVGTDRIGDSLGPQLADILHQRTGSTVDWRIAGANSAVSEQVRDHVLPHLEPLPYTHIVMCVGMNDMKNFLSARRFKMGFGGLLYALHTKWPEATLIWTPLLDMATVPSLPPLLARILEMRASILNPLGKQLCYERCAIVTPRLDSTNPEGFSVDGFHASPAGYHYWAGVVADTIIQHQNPDDQPTDKQGGLILKTAKPPPASSR